MVRKFPEWLRKGAKISVNSAVFGLVKATITEVTDKKIIYQPERNHEEYSCSIGYMSTMMMINEGSLSPL